jgi:hypothetical protein
MSPGIAGLSCKRPFVRERTLQNAMPGQQGDKTNLPAAEAARFRLTPDFAALFVLKFFC